MYFFPYPELTLDLLDDDLFELKVPWMRIKIRSKKLSKNSLEKLNRAHDEKDLGVFFKDESLQHFLGSFVDYPVAFFMSQPRVLAESTLQIKRGFTFQLQGSTPHDYTFKRPWLFHSCYSTRMTDALDLWSSFRRYLWQYRYDHHQTSGLLKKLEACSATQPSAFVFIASVMVRQGLYITENCDGALSRGDIHDTIRQPLAAFRQSELHHDKLMRASLRALGYPTDSELPLFPATIALMQLLSSAAASSPFVLAVCLDAFEGGIKLSSSGILGNLLLKNSYTRRGAKGLLAHHEINDRGGHRFIGRSLSERISSIDLNEATQAFYHVSGIMECMQTMAQEVEYYCNRFSNFTASEISS